MQVLYFVTETVGVEYCKPATLFLFGSYTIGKERLYLEVGHFLQRKARVLACRATRPALHHLPSSECASMCDRNALLCALVLVQPMQSLHDAGISPATKGLVRWCSSGC